MKQLILIAAMVITSAFATTGGEPDFTCVEDSGFTYEFYFKDFTEIHQYDETGVFIGMIDGLDYDLLFLESHPPVYKYTFFYGDGSKNEVAQVQFRGDSITGSGEMTDNDQKMECVRK